MKKLIYVLLFVFALSSGSVFSQSTYTSTKGFSFTIPAAWKDMPISVYFKGRDAGSVTYQDLGIDKNLMLASDDTLKRPYITVFALGDTKAQDFETAISDANSVFGLGVMTFTSADDIKSLIIANSKRVFVDKERKIIIGEGDPDAVTPSNRTIAATIMGDTKAMLMIYYSNEANLSQDIDRFLEIAQSVRVD